MHEREIQLPRRAITGEEIRKIFNIDYKRLVADTLSRVLLDSRALSFFASPKEHKGSQALYLAEEMVGEDMVFVSYLCPNGKTTIHKHQEPVMEKYFQLAGSSYLRLGSDLHELVVDSVLTVPSDVPHQLTTRDSPSLVLIVMENAISVPRDKLHVPIGPAQIPIFE